MPNKIKPKRSYTTNSVPLTTDLEAHELAINWADGVAYTKNASGQIVSVPLGGSGGGGSGLSWASVPASATATGTAGQIAYDGEYFYVATAANTWKRAALATWTVFTPATITGLQLWLDASDASTLYDATSGGSLVAADGSVARWEDKSGNARHFTQATSGSRPTRKTSQQNGKDTLLFDGTNDTLVGSDFLDLNTGGLTAFFVYKRNATGARHELLAKTTSSEGFGWILFQSDADKLTFRAQGANKSTARETSAAVTVSTYSVISAKVTAGSISGSSFFKNGQSIAMAAATNGTASLETPENTSGLLRVGAQEYAGDLYFPLNANIAEIVLYDSALSDANREAVENYLLAKWGI